MIPKVRRIEFLIQQHPLKMPFNEDKEKTQNYGSKIDLAKIIAQYQMQRKSTRSSPNYQSGESYGPNMNDHSKSKIKAFGTKSQAIESPAKLPASENISLKPAPKSFGQPTSTTRSHHVSQRKHAMPAKSASQKLKQKDPKQSLAQVATKDNASHVTSSSSANGTVTNPESIVGLKPTSLNHNSKSKVCNDLIHRPKRPLSAYNIFFRDQRLKLLEQQEINNENWKLRTNSHNPSKAAKKQHTKNAASDKKKPNSIGFSQLAKTVSVQWKLIDPQQRAYYDTQAQLDLERYRKERDLYQETKMEALSQARLQLEMTVDSDTRKRYFQEEQRKTESKRKK